jgi:hypothetical protein
MVKAKAERAVHPLQSEEEGGISPKTLDQTDPGANAPPRI